MDLFLKFTELADRGSLLDSREDACEYKFFSIKIVHCTRCGLKKIQA